MHFNMKSVQIYEKSRCRKKAVFETNNLPEGLDVVGTVGTTSEIRQVELNLIPALVESHGHRADERLNTGRALVVRGSESPAHVLVIEHLHLESEVFLQLHARKKVVRICEGAFRTEADLRS